VNRRSIIMDPEATVTRRQTMLALAALPWSACARRRKPTTQVRVVALPYFNMAPLYLAHEGGYFAEQGLRIEIQEMEGSNAAIPLLSARQADAAFFGVSAPLVNAVVRGARVRIVAGRQVYSPNCLDQRRFYGSQLAFPRGFNDLSQIKGQKLCAPRSNGMSGFILAQALAAAGLHSSDVVMMSLTDEKAAATLLAAGKLDVLLPSAEYDIGLTPLRERVVPGPAVGSFLPNFMYSTMIFGKRFLDDSPEDGKRFLTAYLKGTRDFLAGKTPRFFDRLAERDGQDPNLVRQRCRDGQLLDGRIQMGDLQRFIDWSLNQKYIPVPVSAEQIVDRRFLKS
jgi:NitT/TauT family transport system substrate-binding protein